MPTLPIAGHSVRDTAALETTEDWAPLGQTPRVLMVWPRFPPSFWGFEGMLRLLPEKSVMPPLGLITVAALCPPQWRLTLVDCAFDVLRDEDILGADLVMLSAMHAQRFEVWEILARCRKLGRRTIVGGPYASSQPEVLLDHADHVVIGEVDECFGDIARGLEAGRAQRLYRIEDKPDVTHRPMPRFDLLRLANYSSMSVQFSRGCPFQCEFCDIITIYGRKPRTKSPAELIGELDALLRLGWRKDVFVVDDNFIGNRRAALQLVKEIIPWQQRHGYPLSLYTEASIDLAAHPDLMDAMAEANFQFVFIGIESPSEASLRESLKFQNLRSDNAAAIDTIQKRGLWVTGGFIVGFDSDDETIFNRQTAFIERTAIPWAMTGVLQAPPTTALYERLEREGRLLADSDATTNFSVPNFRTKLPTDVLLSGLSRMLLELYEPERFFARALRSLEAWTPHFAQTSQRPVWHYQARVAVASLWHQGIRSNYRGAYWRFVGAIMWRWRRDPVRMWRATVLLLSAHHFLRYARETAGELQGKAVVWRNSRGFARPDDAVPPSPSPAIAL
jgi:radical SAM superfamily enzyme YgiQ (UPF0313 family)